MLSARLKNYLHFHFIVLIWGLTAVLGALISIDAIPLVWYRMALASGFIWLYIKVQGISVKVSSKLLRGLLVAGSIIALHWIAFFQAIKVSNVSVALVVMSTGAFFTSILEPIFYKRKVIPYEVFFGVVVIIGLSIIFSFEGRYIEGILYALVSALLSAVFSLINGVYAKHHNASVISFYELLGGALGITLYLFVTNAFSLEFFSLALEDWTWLLILASVCTSYAFMASVAVMRYLSPYTVMLTINLEPVYGILLAYLIFGESERMSHQFYYGALLILATVIINGVLKNRGKMKKVIKGS